MFFASPTGKGRNRLRMPSCGFAEIFHRRCHRIAKKSHDNRNRECAIAKAMYKANMRRESITFTFRYRIIVVHLRIKLLIINVTLIKITNY